MKPTSTSFPVTSHIQSVSKSYRDYSDQLQTLTHFTHGRPPGSPKPPLLLAGSCSPISLGGSIAYRGHSHSASKLYVKIMTPLLTKPLRATIDWTTWPQTLRCDSLVIFLSFSCLLCSPIALISIYISLILSPSSRNIEKGHGFLFILFTNESTVPDPQ